jgi:hypothetical protein
MSSSVLVLAGSCFDVEPRSQRFPKMTQRDIILEEIWQCAHSSHDKTHTILTGFGLALCLSLSRYLGYCTEFRKVNTTNSTDSLVD